MKEPYNFEIEKELPGVMRDAIRQHPWKKLLQEEEARIRQGASSGNQPPLISGSARVVPIWRRLAAIAAVLLVVSVSGYFVWQEFLAPPQLLAVSMVILPDLSVTANDPAEKSFRLGRDAFSQKEYGQAVDFFKQVPSSVDYYYDAQFLMGHAYHLSKEFKKAIPLYELFLKNDLALMSRLSGQYQREDHIRWNLALACWGDGQKDRTRAELNKLKLLPSISDKLKQDISKLEKEF